MKEHREDKLLEELVHEEHEEILELKEIIKELRPVEVQSFIIHQKE